MVNGLDVSLKFGLEFLKSVNNPRNSILIYPASEMSLVEEVELSLRDMEFIREQRKCIYKYMVCV